jgi:hypothetical protein
MRLSGEDASLLRLCLQTIDVWLRDRNTDVFSTPAPAEVVSSAIVTVDMLLHHLRTVRAAP